MCTASGGRPSKFLVDVKSKVTSAHPLTTPENSEGKNGETAEMGFSTRTEGGALPKGHVEQSVAGGQRAFRVFATSDSVVFTRSFPTVETYTRSVASVSHPQVSPTYSEYSPEPTTNRFSHGKIIGRFHRSEGLFSVTTTYLPESLKTEEVI